MRWQTVARAALGFGIALTACTATLNTSTAQCRTTQDCLDKGPSFVGTICSATQACVKEPGCSNAKECIEQNGGRPHVCRHSDRVCVPLETTTCKLNAEAGDVGDENTLWVGALFPMTGASASHGEHWAGAVDLARRDFVTVGGLPAAGAQPARKVGVVVCDDGTDDFVTASSKHLFDELHVPAVIGFRSSGVAISVAQTYGIRTGTLMVTGDCGSPLITGLPTSNPRLFWRSVPSSPEAPAIAAAVEPLYEQRVRNATPPILTDPVHDPIRVAVVYIGNALGRANVDVMQPLFKFNGKGATENGANYQAFTYGDPTQPDSDVRYAAVIAGLMEFKPHLVIGVGGLEVSAKVIGPMETKLATDGYPFKPFYAVTAGALQPELYEAVNVNDDLRLRVSGANYEAIPATLEAFTARLAAAHPGMKLDATTSTLTAATYDAFYSLVYAAAAVGDAPISGVAMAHGMTKLIPTSESSPRVDTGPEGIRTAFEKLPKGEAINFGGVFGPLLWDPATGDPKFGGYFYCLGKDPATGAAKGTVPSGFVFDAARKVGGVSANAGCL